MIDKRSLLFAHVGVPSHYRCNPVYFLSFLYLSADRISQRLQCSAPLYEEHALWHWPSEFPPKNLGILFGLLGQSQNFYSLFAITLVNSKLLLNYIVEPVSSLYRIGLMQTPKNCHWCDPVAMNLFFSHMLTFNSNSVCCPTLPLQCCVFPAAIVLMDSWTVLLRNLWHEHLNRSLVYDLRRTLNKIISKNENTRVCFFLSS